MWTMDDHHGWRKGDVTTGQVRFRIWGTPGSRAFAQSSGWRSWSSRVSSNPKSKERRVVYGPPRTRERCHHEVVTHRSTTVCDCSVPSQVEIDRRTKQHTPYHADEKEVPTRRRRGRSETAGSHCVLCVADVGGRRVKFVHDTRRDTHAEHHAGHAVFRQDAEIFLGRRRAVLLPERTQSMGRDGRDRLCHSGLRGCTVHSVDGTVHTCMVALYDASPLIPRGDSLCRELTSRSRDWPVPPTHTLPDAH